MRRYNIIMAMLVMLFILSPMDGYGQHLYEKI